MDTAQALAYLGLNDNASQAEVTSAINKKQQQLDSLLDKAPTDALKQKYQASLEQLTEAKACLCAAELQPGAISLRSSSLSQTKLADLPGITPGGANIALDGISLEEGVLLAGRYQIKEKIAEGGMGVVYRAFDQNRDQDIAIKVMLPELMRNESARERFLDEARLSSQLSHPNIVNVYDVQQANLSDGSDWCFLTMELLQGQDLRQLMENRALARQSFSLEEVLEILVPICAALDHAHELTVHRDIKPENIFLCDDGKYKLMDFGIARIMSTSQRTQTGAASGTAYYMAPEQLKGQKDIDGRADQYALAVLVYELLSGEVPAGAIEPLHSLVKAIDRKTSDAVQKALSPKPVNRFSNLNDFVAALGSKGGFSFPVLNTEKLTVPLMLMLGVLLLGGVFGSGLLSLDSLLPMSQEEIAQRRAVSAQLIGEIRVIKQRLHNGRRSLVTNLRSANAANSKSLDHWQKLTEEVIFDGVQLTELEGTLAMAESWLGDEDFDQAEQSYRVVRDGYQTLYKNFQAAESLYQREQKATLSESNWAELKRRYLVSADKLESEATLLMNEARKEQDSGRFDLARQHWMAADHHWSSVVRSVNDELEEKYEQEKKRQAEAVRKKRIADAKRAAEVKRSNRLRDLSERESNANNHFDSLKYYLDETYETSTGGGWTKIHDDRRVKLRTSSDSENIYCTISYKYTKDHFEYSRSDSNTKYKSMTAYLGSGVRAKIRYGYFSRTSSYFADIDVLRRNGLSESDLIQFRFESSSDRDNFFSYLKRTLEQCEVSVMVENVGRE